MKLNHNEEKIVRMMEAGVPTAERIAEMLGKGYTEQKAQSMVLTLARKGAVDKTKAALILHGTPMLKLLAIPFGATLRK